MYSIMFKKKVCYTSGAQEIFIELKKKKSTAKELI
jgi:hypothetical protein